MKNNMSESQPNNPLHGIKLAEIIEYLHNEYGWEEMGEMININCFKKNPTIKSSLKFLRRTPWARDKVEKLYLETIPTTSLQ
jgi:uncharacterized protein (DUF2132 family)